MFEHPKRNVRRSNASSQKPGNDRPWNAWRTSFDRRKNALHLMTSGADPLLRFLSAGSIDETPASNDLVLWMSFWMLPNHETNP
jgi:hypothetical protein